MRNNKELKGLIKSFTYAFRGIMFCIRNERNMRIHLTAAIYVFIFAVLFEFTCNQIAILGVAVVLVIATEMINTAIETVLNLTSSSYDNLARIGKDVAAGAVFITTVFAVVVGFLLFFDIKKIVMVFYKLIDNPFIIIAIVLSIPLAIIFIFVGPNKIRLIKDTGKINKRIKHND